MKKSRFIFSALCLVVSAGLFQSCATILGGRSNTLVFNDHQNVQAQVIIDSTVVGTSPGKIKIPKSAIQHGSVLEIRAEGYETQTYTILRRPHDLYVLANILIGGAPLLVDFATGNILRPEPRIFNLEMEKSK